MVRPLRPDASSARRLRGDGSGVASTVATMLTLFVVLIFMEAAIISIAPQQQYTAEWVTSRQALESLDMMRSALAGPALPGSTFSVPIPLGTPATSPFAIPSEGALHFDEARAGGPTISLSFVPHFQSGRLEKINQDVVLVIDSSGSMWRNDRTGLRYQAAKQYIDTLERPDRVAIVDFDTCSALTRLVVTSCNSATGLPRTTTGVAHHLYACGHDGDPDPLCGGYAEAKSDLDRFTCPGLQGSGPGCQGGTNFGVALRLANNEFVANGNLNHEWVIILLTDGNNEPSSWDPVALSEAARSKALGIRVYTIALIGTGTVDEDILRQIAATTGGTYYRAPTAEDLRFIYYSISRRYSGAFACGGFQASDISLGLVSLNLAATQYPRQSMRVEGGALSLLQGTGSLVHAGIPMDYTPTSNSSGELEMTLLTYIGGEFSAVGTDVAILQARVIARDVTDQTITKVNLTQRADALANTSANLLFWLPLVVTPTAAIAIRTPLEHANASIRWADVNVSRDEITSAKFNIDRAQSNLSAALTAVADQTAMGNIDRDLANQTRDEIALVGCQIDQWLNWYEGVTIRIVSPAAQAWALWLDQTFRDIGEGVSIGLEGEVAVLSIHAIDRFILDRRIIELSLGR